MKKLSFVGKRLKISSVPSQRKKIEQQKICIFCRSPTKDTYLLSERVRATPSRSFRPRCHRASFRPCYRYGEERARGEGRGEEIGEKFLNCLVTSNDRRCLFEGHHIDVVHAALIGRIHQILQHRHLRPHGISSFSPNIHFLL
jgi:hypothetical protein